MPVRKPTGTSAHRTPWLVRIGGGLLAACALFALGACATPHYTTRPAAAEPPPPVTQVYFYPARGQDATRQDRDRYECYLWARQQTGFDPSSQQLAPHQRVEVVPLPPAGHDTAAGAVAGAVLGAVIAPSGRTGQGAAVGAVTGAMLGAASDAARQEHAAQLQQQLDKRQASGRARVEQQAMNYRRALTACLLGRGYSVR